MTIEPDYTFEVPGCRWATWYIHVADDADVIVRADHWTHDGRLEIEVWQEWDDVVVLTPEQNDRLVACLQSAELWS